MAETKKKTFIPGWYVRHEYHKTLCYWDGTAWTGQTAPQAAGLTTGMIAQGVALGSVAGVILARLLFGIG